MYAAIQETFSVKIFVGDVTLNAQNITIEFLYCMEGNFGGRKFWRIVC